MDKKEFRILIKYGFLKGKNTVEAETWLDAEFPDTIAGKSTIKDWYAKFRRSDMITEDGKRNGHPKEDATDYMILNDRKLKMNELADTLKISIERVHHITHEYLGMRKLCAKWVPHELTFDQKQRLVDDSKQCLKVIKRNKPEFLGRYVTMDQTWLHYF
ncbi:hypothetical protein GWI33_016311 [Rhynchophorus ferrugineus]|uniref:Uncharacterized protein n=1 Tax=Rhynchophorus ferrugineus TaxID=354439 RepID=A0A834HYY9_RHYFE|nr:hypothetical protein GWI33_016311 [Rhynchophorus ferrugineus]